MCVPLPTAKDNSLCLAVLRFTSDMSVAADGFSARFSCGAPAPPPSRDMLACHGAGVTLYEHGLIGHFNEHGHSEDCRWTAVCEVGAAVPPPQASPHLHACLGVLYELVC